MDGRKRCLLLGFACFLALFLQDCFGEAADRYADASLQSLMLDRKEHVMDYKNDLGDDVLLRYQDIGLREFNRAYRFLSGRMSSHNSEQELMRVHGVSSMLKNTVETHQKRLEDGLPVDGSFRRERDLYVRRADTLVVSFLERDMLHRGGPSPSGDLHSVRGRNLDSQSGKYILLQDVFTDWEGVASAVEKELRRSYPEAAFHRGGSLGILELLQACDEKLKEGLGGMQWAEANEGTATWTLEPRGVTFYFNPPSLGAFRDGIYTVTLLFDEYPELFQEKYRRGPLDYCMELMPQMPVRTTLGNGRNISVGVYDSNPGLLIDCGRERFQDTSDMDDARLVLVSLRDGRSYLYAACTVDKVYHDLRVFKLDGKPMEKKVFAHWGFRDAPVPRQLPKWRILSDPGDFLLTMDGSETAAEGSLTHRFRVGTDGLPEQVD